MRHQSGTRLAAVFASAQPRMPHGTAPRPEENAALADALLAARTGPVLQAGAVLKADHFDAAAASAARVAGAPNFRRSVACGRVYGCAQPTAPGVLAVLRLLAREHRATVTWISTREEPVAYVGGRPFVLRPRAAPFANARTYAGISAARLEAVEQRLVADICREADANGGLVVVHEEAAAGTLCAQICAADTVETSRSLFACLSSLGGVDGVRDGQTPFIPSRPANQSQPVALVYRRVPVGRTQAPTDAYVDAYVAAVRGAPGPVVFSCGMGVHRTTQAMVMAELLLGDASLVSPPDSPVVGGSGRTEKTVAADCLAGNYRAVCDVVRALAGGRAVKAAVDAAVDSCGAVVNIRTAIFGHLRAHAQHTVMVGGPTRDTEQADPSNHFSGASHRGDDAPGETCTTTGQPTPTYNLQRQPDTSPVSLSDAVQQCSRAATENTALVDQSVTNQASAMLPRQGETATWDEKAINNIAGQCKQPTAQESIARARRLLATYVFLVAFGAYAAARDARTFSAWLDDHRDVARILRRVSESGDARDFLPFAVNTDGASAACLRAPLDIHTVLKTDAVPGVCADAPRLRTVAPRIYAVGTPHRAGVAALVTQILVTNSKVCWVNLREEPFVYVAGEPHVLRAATAPLRNTSAHAGISAARLEALEERLARAVARAPSAALDERFDGTLAVRRIPPDAPVESPRRVISTCCSDATALRYVRVPTTAERAMSPRAVDAVVCAVRQAEEDSAAIVFSCHTGGGRSTAASVLALLFRQIFGRPVNSEVQCESEILSGHKDALSDRQTAGMRQSGNDPPAGKDESTHTDGNARNTADASMAYEAVHTLVRVLPMGAEAKRLTDACVAACAAAVHLRDVVETLRVASDRSAPRALLRYVVLVLAACWLVDQREGNCTASFAQWLEMHEDVAGMVQTLRRATGVALVAETAAQAIADAQAEEIMAARRGSVLGPWTMLKDDHFPGCARRGLDGVPGAPNYRCAGHDVHGAAMPTSCGIANVAAIVENQTADAKAPVWVCLREEPVVFVAGRPYVLRVLRHPAANIEARGIAHDRLEEMERRLAAEARAEAARCGGRLLVHGECALTGRPVAVWRPVSEADVCAPADVFCAALPSGFDYVRVPATDEREPLPPFFDALHSVIEAHGSAVFSCQMGRGRTTTAMVYALMLRMAGDVDSCSESEDIEVPDALAALLPLLDDGRAAVRLLRAATRAAAHMQDVWAAACAPGAPPGYGPRLYWLLAAADHAVSVRGGCGASFCAWLAERPEILRLSERLSGE